MPFGAKVKAWTLLRKLSNVYAWMISGTVVTGPLLCSSSQDCYVSWEGDAREDRDPSTAPSTMLSERVRVKRK